FSDIAVIYDKYLDILYSYALHLGFDEQTAMDAIHDVFYKLCINHSSLKEISNLKFYLFRSLRNRLIDIQRTNKEFTGIFQNQENTENNFRFQLHATVEDLLIQQEDAEEIRKKVEAVLNQLTARQREIIYLRYIQEYSYEEIAELLKISVAACRNLVSKSFHKLKTTSLQPVVFLLIISRF
ncbi:MAG: sigma-70 family RNA polymerase sigma factor, partial [Massilibacteroides sp.]|nr:sigma-70 family RNA polymerase sigma factor [Massilibacteroides sp.]